MRKPIEFNIHMSTTTSGCVQVTNATVFKREKTLAEILSEDEKSELLARITRLIGEMRFDWGVHGFRMRCGKGLAPDALAFIHIIGNEKVSEGYSDYATTLAEVYHLLMNNFYYDDQE